MKKLDIKDLFVSNGMDYKDFLKEKIDKLATEIIFNKYPQHKQINASLGLYNEEILNEIKLFISQIIRISTILKSKVNEDKITTEEEITERAFKDYL